MTATRQQAAQAFLKQGVPNKRTEEYRYTPVEHFFKANETLSQLQSLAEGNQLTASNDHSNEPGHETIQAIDQLSSSIIAIDPGAIQITLFNGKILAGQTIVAKDNQQLITLKSDSQPLFDQKKLSSADPFLAINWALFTDAVDIHIPSHFQSDSPIYIHQIYQTQSGVFVNPNVNIYVHAHAKVTFIDRRIDQPTVETPFVINHSTNITLEQGAHVVLYKIQNDLKCSLVDTVEVHQSENSHFEILTLNCNSNWIRNTLNITVAGQHCNTVLKGLTVAKAEQFVDNHTLVDHQQPHCESNQLYKTILTNKATGVFNGKIFVRRDAQKINAFQSSKNNVLSDEATMNTKPQLEIYADDVKCSHGSTTGQLDEEALFYLQSRGLGLESAKGLLLEAFAADILQSIQIEALRELQLNELAGLLKTLAYHA